MIARDHLTLLAKQWRVIVGVGLVGALVAVGLVLVAPVKYAASVTLFISTDQSRESSTDAYQGSLLSQNRVKTYTQLLSSYRLGQEVVADLGTPDDPQAIADEITASVSPSTVLLTAEVTDTSPERAVAIASAIGRRFPALVMQLERSPNPAMPPTVTSTVVQGPILTPGPVSPQPALWVALGLVAGLLAGAGFAVARRTLDRSIHTGEELVAVVPKPLLGTLVDDRSVSSSPLFLRDRPSSPIAENLRAIRTNFDMFDFDRSAKVFVVTSSVEDEGKSTLLVNLALAQAAAGRRVLLVEADLRKPRIARYLGLPGSVGLTQVLPGRVELADAVQNAAVHLDLLAGGPQPPNPCEMVESDQMAELLDRMRESYDLVLVDAPPLLPVADSLALARRSDGVVFTVRASSTSSALVARAYAMLETAGVRNVGLVLNRVSDRAEGYSYGYYSERTRGGQEPAADPTSGVPAAAEPTAPRRPSPRPVASPARQEFATVPRPADGTETPERWGPYPPARHALAAPGDDPYADQWVEHDWTELDTQVATSGRNAR